jgi:hypothetical protein
VTCPSHLHSGRTWRRRILLGVSALGIAWLLSSCGEDEPPPSPSPVSQQPAGYRMPPAPTPQWGQQPQQPWGQQAPQQWGQPSQPQWGQQPPPSAWGGQGQGQTWGAGQPSASSGQVQGQWGVAGGMAPPVAQSPWQVPPAGYGGQAMPPQQRGWAQPQPMGPQFRPLEEERAKEYQGAGQALYAPYDRPMGSSQDRSQVPGWTGYPATPPGYPGIAPAPWGWPGATGLPPVW